MRHATANIWAPANEQARACRAAVVELRALALPGALHKVQRKRARLEAGALAEVARKAQQRADRALEERHLRVLEVGEVQARLRMHRSHMSA